MPLQYTHGRVDNLKGPRKAKIRIEFPALHRITVDQWSKTDSIHSYKAEEFSRRLLNLRATMQIQGRN